MIPQIGTETIQDIKFAPFPSFTYNVKETRIIGDVDGLEALKQSIYRRILTERYAYSIYDGNYGTELEQYIGQSFEFLETTIENTLRDSLLQDDRISNVIVTSVTRDALDSALITFDVFTNLGIISGLEVGINV